MPGERDTFLSRQQPCVTSGMKLMLACSHQLGGSAQARDQFGAGAGDQLISVRHQRSMPMVPAMM